MDCIALALGVDSTTRVAIKQQGPANKKLKIIGMIELQQHHQEQLADKHSERQKEINQVQSSN